MMKNHVSLTILFLSLVLCAGLSAQTTLSAPVNLQIADGILTWDAVENANRYVVWSDSPLGQFIVDNVAATLYKIPSHVPNIALLRVRARGDGFNESAWSEPIYNGPPLIWLDTPTNLRVIDNVLFWDSVENSVGYQLTRNGNTVPNVEGNSHALGQLHQGTHVFRVRAGGDSIIYGLSEWSEPFNHQVGPPPDPKPAENLSATVQQNTVILTWDAPIWEHTNNIVHYVVIINGVLGGEEVNLPISTQTSRQINNLQNGEYTFYVLTAYTIDGFNRLSEPSNTVNAVIETVNDTDEVIILFETALLDNFPNPFNPETVIRLNLANDTFVSIEIYNARGQKVRSLVNGEMSRGEHSVVWNGRDDNGVNVSSGVYFYKMTAGEYQSVRRMVLMK